MRRSGGSGTLRHKALVIVALALSMGSLARAQQVPAGPPRLLSTDSLAAWQARGMPVRLLDVRLDVWTYLKGHLPDAQYLNIETLRASKGGVPVQLLDGSWYGPLFRRLGLDPDIPVVVYSAGETLNIDATFAVWLLASMGHPRVFLLDGGSSKWSFENREIARAYPAITPAGPWWTIRVFRPHVATLADVQQGMKQGVLFVDARPHEQYIGDAGAQMRLGHLPGAINHYWQDDLETVGFGRVFRSVDSLRASYLAQGIEPERDIILYCNSATEASHVYFVLKYLLDYPRVRIYAGSWTEWAGHADLPIERGEGPRHFPIMKAQ